MLPANWRTGLAAVAEVGVFVSPPVDGWILLAGADVAAADPETELLPRLAAASRAGGIAAWFRADAAADEFGWALALDGDVVRAYAFTGEHGPVLWHGPVTSAERELGCFVDDPRDHSDDDVKWWPDRAIVDALAAAWTKHPATVAASAREPAIGAIGRL